MILVDALTGLTDICKMNAKLTASNLGQIVNGLLKLFIDSDRDVRKSTLNYLKESWIDLDKADLQPFIPILVMYTCSAMTHIFEDVRTDAVKFLDFWILMSPEPVVSKFWNRITGNYMSLVSVDANKSMETVSSQNHTTTAAIKSASEKSHLHIHKNKLVFFTSLCKFFDAGLSGNKQDNHWFFLNYLDSKHAKESFKRKIDRHNSIHTEDTYIWSSKKKNVCIPIHPNILSAAPNLSSDITLASFSHLDLFDSSGPKNNTTNTQGAVDSHEFSKEERLDGIDKIIETFQPILVASWLESAPSVFVTSSLAITPAFELVDRILQLSVIMWRAAVSSQKIKHLGSQWLYKHLEVTLKHFLVYFPFGADGIGLRDGKVVDRLMQMNISFCELVSLFLLAKAAQGSIEAPEWTEDVVYYLMGLLGHEEQSTSDFKADHLATLLPALWGLLNCVPEEVKLMDTIFDFHEKCQSAAINKVASDFIFSIYTIQETPHYNGNFKIHKDSTSQWRKALESIK
ncbi:Rix1 complex component [Sporodiniella umbellata]|nr:Rix1 complex component [Sporodiniella umbellata]